MGGTAPEPFTMKKQTQHTPGPWRAHDIEAFVVLAPDGRTVAYAQGQPRSSGANEANARLIAAAPDLLAALQNAVRCGERDALGTGAPKWTVAARVAIARATVSSLSPEIEPQDASASAKGGAGEG